MKPSVVGLNHLVRHLKEIAERATLPQATLQWPQLCRGTELRRRIEVLKKPKSVNTQLVPEPEAYSFVDTQSITPQTVFSDP